MVPLFLAALGALRVFFRSRSDTALEILALRQQLAVLKTASAAALEFWRPLLLDDPPPLLVPLDRCPPNCPTGDRRGLASRQLSTLLAVAVPVHVADHARSQGFDRTSRHQRRFFLDFGLSLW
jgi:hypothetical protein